VSFRAGKCDGEPLKNMGTYTPSQLIFYNHVALHLPSCTATPANFTPTHYFQYTLSSPVKLMYTALPQKANFSHISKTDIHLMPTPKDSSKLKILGNDLHCHITTSFATNVKTDVNNFTQRLNRHQ
jgi:hypothetical protein